MKVRFTIAIKRFLSRILADVKGISHVLTVKANYPGSTVERMRSNYQAEKDPNLKKRYVAIRLSYEGDIWECIADILDRQRVTVQDWVPTFNEKGLESL